MSLERLTLSATTLLFTAARAASGARVQAAQACGGKGAGPAKVDGWSFILADGREVRLAAIETLLPVPGDQDEARGSFAGAGVTPKSLAGRMIDVRGFIEERGGRAVAVTRPAQIEIVH